MTLNNLYKADHEKSVLAVKSKIVVCFATIKPDRAYCLSSIYKQYKVFEKRV